MSAAPRPSLATGDRLGDYEIVRPIGEGGMAELFVARAPTGIAGFRRVVALKRILPQLSADPEFIDMFMNEAQLAGLLQHPNIATLYEFGQSEGDTFFTMEYVHGVDLRKLIRRASDNKRGLKLSFVLTIITAVAAGLHHAHELRDGGGHSLSIVHRDVSPTNILIGYDGSIKVVDFGIAKALTRRTKTRTGQVKGKVHYLSPEQCKGDKLDRRSDIFSLAIILYELTTGRRMFAGKDDFAVMHQLVNEQVVPPSTLRDDYDPELEAIVVKALQRDPDDRYETAQDFQEALEDFARENKLSLSTVGLGRFMRELYGDVPEPAHEITNPAYEPTSPDTSSAQVAVADLSKSRPLQLRRASRPDEDEVAEQPAVSGDATNNSLSAHVPHSERDNRDGIWRTIAALAVAGMVATAVLAASGVFSSAPDTADGSDSADSSSLPDSVASSELAQSAAQQTPSANASGTQQALGNATPSATPATSASASAAAAPAKTPVAAPPRRLTGPRKGPTPPVPPPPPPPPVLSDGGFWN